jgi:hypothetical protein
MYIRTELEIRYPLTKNGYILNDNMEQAEELVIRQSKPGILITSYHITNVRTLAWLKMLRRYIKES